MIRISFVINRETISFEINEKKIKYFDRKWSQGFQFMPKDEGITKVLLMNQRVYPLAQQMVAWINEANSGKDLEEYNAAKTDEEIADIVRRDARSRGCVEIKI